MAHNFFGQPSEKMKLVGVTGTNGKQQLRHYYISSLQHWDINVDC